MALANLFMDRGADMSKTDNSGNNALHLSIERGLKVVALKVLAKCPDLVSSHNINGNTPLHFAAAIGDVSLCEKLLLCERKVTATNINGETSLHIATLVPNNLDTLKILIERGMCTPRGHLSRDVYPGVRSGSCPRIPPSMVAGGKKCPLYRTLSLISFTFPTALSWEGAFSDVVDCLV